MNADKITSTPRILYVDILKAFACLAVVIIHTSSAGVYTSDYYVLTSYISLLDWCVPVFMISTGVLYLGIDGKEISYKYMLSKALHVVLIILFWGMIYDVITLIMMNHAFNLSILLKALKMVLTADTSYCYQFWYLYVLVGMYLMIPLLDKYVKNSKEGDIRILIYIYIAFSFVLPTVLAFINEEIDSTHVWKSAFINFAGFCAYMLIGFYLHQNKLKRKTLIALAGIFIAQFALTVFLIIKKNDFFSVFVSSNTTYGCTISILAVLLAKRIETSIASKKILKKIIQFISKYSLGIYIYHVVFIQLCRKIFGIDTSFAPLWISGVLVSLLVFGLSLTASWVTKKIPILKRLV